MGIKQKLQELAVEKMPDELFKKAIEKVWKDSGRPPIRVVTLRQGPNRAMRRHPSMQMKCQICHKEKEVKKTGGKVLCVDCYNKMPAQFKFLYKYDAVSDYIQGIKH